MIKSTKEKSAKVSAPITPPAPPAAVSIKIPEWATKLLVKYWWVLGLAAVFLFALWLRLLPLPNFANFLPDIDTYFFVRMTEYAANHGLTLPAVDALRFYPTGYGGYSGYFVGFLYPAAVYSAVKGLGVAFMDFVKVFPMLLGAFFTVPVFLIGRELKDAKAGLLAAFLFATSVAASYRTSILEKEVLAGPFMLFAIYFFIRAVKKNSWISGIAAGLCTAMVATIWGGILQMFFGMFILVALLLLVNRAPPSLFRAYAPTVLLGMFLPSMFLLPLGYSKHPGVIMNLIMLALLALRLAAEKYKWVKQETLPYLAPVLFSIGGLTIFVGSIFSKVVANIIVMAQTHLTYGLTTFSSTVAENAPTSWGMFDSQLSTIYASYISPIFSSPVFIFAAAWFLAAAGVMILLWKMPERKWDKWAMLLAALSAFGSYIGFLQTYNPAAQTIFLLSFFALIFLVSRRDWLATFLLVMLFIPMLGALTRGRILFIAAPFFAVFAGYALSAFIDFARDNRIVRALKTQEHKITYYSIAALLIGVVLFANGAAGYVAAIGISPGFNNNFDEALKFMRNQTPEGSVILSWWDYGYWFQLMANRPTNMDGGNEMAVARNTPAAQYFTGLMNSSQQKYFLQKYGTDYILVDTSMIGKFSAMSKIASFGQRVDAYQFLEQGQVFQRNNKTVVTYGNGVIWVPTWPNGTLAGDILVETQGGEGYIRYACSAAGAIDLQPPDDKPAADWAIMPVQGGLYVVTAEVCNSPNTRLIFFGGAGLDYVTRVFFNQEVQVYEVDHSIIPRETTEELQKWWATHNYTELLGSYPAGG